MLSAPGLAPTPISRAVCEPMGLPPISRPWLRLLTMLTRPMASTSKTAVASGIGAHARRIAGDADQVAHARACARPAAPIGCPGCCGRGSRNGCTASMPACCWMSWQVTCALMRALARGPSGTLMQSMPCSAQRRAPSISREASTPRGGRISTNATNLPGGQFGAELGFFAPSARAAGRAPCACGSSTVTASFFCSGLERARFRADQLDVLRAWCRSSRR